jgi:hypothetical protein
LVGTAFYSFHHNPDSHRASQVRNMGVIDGNRPANDEDWEELKRGGDLVIRKWIADQMEEKSVAIILISENTADRIWVRYEIDKAWQDGKGVLGLHVNHLEDSDGNLTKKGSSPFSGFYINGESLNNIVKTYEPPYTSSTSCYDYIKNNLTEWTETAISIRSKYG